MFILVPGSGNGTDGVTISTTMEEPQPLYECELALDGISLKFQKSTLGNGRIYIKYGEEEKRIGYSEDTKLGEFFNNNTVVVGFENEETLEYFKDLYFSGESCPIIDTNQINLKKENDIRGITNYIILKDSMLQMKYSNSDMYKELLGDLVNPLKALDSNILNYELKLDGDTIRLNSISPRNTICADAPLPI